MASQAQAQVQTFLVAAQKDGWFVRIVCGHTVSIKKHFAPGDKNAYCSADMLAGEVLGLVPASGGSVWGTDGATVGGHVGLTNGYYELNKSGVSKRFLAALTKQIGG